MYLNPFISGFFYFEFKFFFYDLHASKHGLSRLFSCGFPNKACFQFRLPLFWELRLYVIRFAPMN